MTTFITYDLETNTTERTKPYVFCFYRLSRLAGRYKRDLTIAFDGDSCVANALDFCLKLKSEERKDKKNKILENNLQPHAHNGSGFDTYIVLNNLPCEKIIVNIIKNGDGVIELKLFTI